ncbi:hypothetical protein A3715_00045, partial [Oleiphilus sp. HI0009]
KFYIYLKFYQYLRGCMFKKNSDGRIIVKSLNEEYQEIQDALLKFKPLKPIKSSSIRKFKASPNKQSIFVLDFKGDKTASSVGSLSKEVSAILSVAKPNDEVFLRLESPGGTITGYGLASQQLIRLREAGIRLVVSVDEIATSGGYMMAAVGDRIIASPTSMLGSIGVIMEVPNFYNLLDRAGVQFHQFTAGKHKRLVSMTNKIGDAAKDQINQDLEKSHELFKNHVHTYRNSVNLESVSHGDVWSAKYCLDNKLVDDLMTSEAYLFDRASRANIFHISWDVERSFSDKLSSFAAQASINTLDKVALHYGSKSKYVF